MLTVRHLFNPELNLPITERLDPLILFVLQMLGLVDNNSAYVCMQLLIFGFGGVLLSSLWEPSTARRLLQGLMLALAALFLGGANPLFLAPHWLPMLAAAFAYLRRSPSITALVLTLIVIVEWSISAGAFSVAGGLLAILLALAVSGEKPKGFGASFFLASAVALCALGIALLPTDFADNYPDGARVVPISPLHTVGAPLLGPIRDPISVLYGSYQASGHLYLYRIELLIFTLAILAVLNALLTRRFPVQAFVALATVTLFVWLELEVGFVDLALTPYQMLRRFIPGLALEALPWPIFLFGLVVSLRSFSKAGSTTFLAAAPIAILALILSHQDRNPTGEGADSTHSTKQAGSSSDEVRNSPSAFVLKTFGDWVANPALRTERAVRNLVPLKPDVDFIWSAEASPLNEEARFAVDDQSETRWRTGRPQQPGDFFLLRFDRPIPVVKAVLMIPASEADFPRGITVQVSEDGRTFRDALAIPDWQGPVQWSDTGYPYFGPQPLVELDLPAQQTVRALKFIQTSSNPMFDWSIAKIKLYRLP